MSDSLVSTEWLASELGAPDLKLADASWHLPSEQRDPRAEYAAAHIPGAVFMDLAELVDPAAPHDNTLPTAEAFASAMERLGIGSDDRIVVYDDSAARTATRAWFMLRLFGARNVAVLDGGLGKWKTEGRPLASGVERLAPARFDGSLPGERLRSKADLLANLQSGAEQVVDARAPARFTGSADEPRPGIAKGHIPGSRNLPYGTLLAPDGTFREPAALREAFAAAGVDLARPVVTSCGSGVSACVLLFALDRLGKGDVALYDGSWAEWGTDPDTPKATGPA